MPKASAKLEGGKELQRALKTLGVRVQRKVLRQAVNAASTPVVKAARRKAPKQSGLLRKSLGKKLKTYTKNGTVMALVGPRKDVEGEHEGEKRRPARYAHLVENGHVAADGTHVPAQPFLRPAFDETQPQALDTMRRKLAAGVVTEMVKAVKQ